MNILAIDDEEIALEGLVSAAKKAESSATIYSFRKPKEALEFFQGTPCEVVLLDIQMRNMSGVELAKEIKFINPHTNIIFATGYADYMKDALEMHVSGYMIKPITAEKVKKELENLRFPIKPERKKRVHIQTFGNFEVFIDGQPVKFKYDLTKEMLAYLVDRRGALCTGGEIMALLRGDNYSPSYYRSLIKDLKDTFSDAGCEDVIIRQRGKIGIDRTKVDCDYYDWLEGKFYAVNLYQGEYMAQYSWSEMTHGGIEVTT